jgi:hypothetical protein
MSALRMGHLCISSALCMCIRRGCALTLLKCIGACKAAHSEVPPACQQLPGAQHHGGVLVVRFGARHALEVASGYWFRQHMQSQARTWCLGCGFCKLSSWLGMLQLHARLIVVLWHAAAATPLRQQHFVGGWCSLCCNQRHLVSKCRINCGACCRLPKRVAFSGLPIDGQVAHSLPLLAQQQLVLLARHDSFE